MYKLYVYKNNYEKIAGNYERREKDLERSTSRLVYAFASKNNKIFDFGERSNTQN